MGNAVGFQFNQNKDKNANNNNNNFESNNMANMADAWKNKENQ